MTSTEPMPAGRAPHRLAGLLLTTHEVAELLGVDRSTVLRMAADGRLLAIKVGRQWRFPTDRLAQQFPALLSLRTPPPPTDDQPPSHTDTHVVIDTNAATRIIQLAAESLNVMMAVTDRDGLPLTDVVNPDPAAIDTDNQDTMLATWQQRAHQPQMAAHFTEGPLGLICAKSPIRYGTQALGFVFAAAHPPTALCGIESAQQQRIAQLLSQIAQLVSGLATTTTTTAIHHPTDPS